MTLLCRCCKVGLGCWRRSFFSIKLLVSSARPRSNNPNIFNLSMSHCHWTPPSTRHLKTARRKSTRMSSDLTKFQFQMPFDMVKAKYCTTSDKSRAHQKSHPLAPHPSVLQKLSEIEDSLRFRGFSTVRIGLGVAFVTGFGIYIFREYIRDNVADEVSTVASRSLDDATFQLKARELAVALLDAILNDSHVRLQTVNFLEDVFSRPDTQAATAELVGRVLSNPDAQHKITVALKYIVQTALDDPAFREELIKNLNYLLQNEITKQVVMQVVEQVLNDEQIKDIARKFVIDIVSSETVIDEATRLGKAVVQDLVSDTLIQEKTGDGLWAAFTYSLRPRWFGGSAKGTNSLEGSGTAEKTNAALLEKGGDVTEPNKLNETDENQRERDHNAMKNNIQTETKGDKTKNQEEDAEYNIECGG